jgi:hypothetical protein
MLLFSVIVCHILSYSVIACIGFHRRQSGNTSSHIHTRRNASRMHVRESKQGGLLSVLSHLNVFDARVADVPNFNTSVTASDILASLTQVLVTFLTLVTLHL